MSKSKRGWLVAVGVGVAGVAALLWQWIKPPDEAPAMSPKSTQADTDRVDETGPQPERAEPEPDSAHDEN